MQLDKDGDYKMVYLTSTEIFQEGQWREGKPPKRIMYLYHTTDESRAQIC